MRPAPQLLLPLALACALAPAARADDEPSLPSAAEARDWFEKLESANRKTIDMGELQVHVSVVPDYLTYLVAKELVFLTEAGTSGDELKEGLERVARKHRSDKRGRVAMIVRLVHERQSESNFFALEGNLARKIELEAVGRGKQRLKAGDQEGKVAVEPFTLFKAALAGIFGNNVLPVIKRTFTCLPKSLTLELLTKKPLDEDKVNKLKVEMGGLVLFSGNIRNNQMDFTNGARATVVKGGEVEFEFPLETPDAPAGVAEILEGAKKKR